MYIRTCWNLMIFKHQAIDETPINVGTYITSSVQQFTMTQVCPDQTQKHIYMYLTRIKKTDRHLVQPNMVSIDLH